MTTISEDQKRFEDIVKEIKSLAKEAINLLPESIYDRAESYWYTHIINSLDEDQKRFEDIITGFTHESVNNMLYEKHPNLSGEWSTLDWNETHAIASYILEDGTIENALVDREGNVKVSDKLMSLMRDI